MEAGIKMENSTDSTGHSKLSTILLKADTGADVNLMNNVTFDSLFDRSLLQTDCLSEWKTMEILVSKC